MAAQRGSLLETGQAAIMHANIMMMRGDDRMMMCTSHRFLSLRLSVYYDTSASMQGSKQALW